MIFKYSIEKYKTESEELCSVGVRNTRFLQRFKNKTGLLFNSAEVTSLLHIGEAFCGKFSFPHCSGVVV